MSDKYVLVDRDGDVAAYWFTDEKAAWAEAEVRMSAPKHYGPYTVAKLVPVPRPVPPRPTMDYLGKTLHVANDLLHFAPDTVYHVCEIGTMRKVIALADATEQWAREHGGAQG